MDGWGSVPIHREFHLGFVVWDRAVDFFELHAEFGVDVPAERGTEESGAEVVHAVFGIPQHDGEVFRYVFEQDMQWVHLLDDRVFVEDAIVEDVTFGF